MGIASLILGILGFLISFSFWADLAIILSVLGCVLGIIALVKKKSKGMAIAGVILAIIALIVTFSDTPAQTGSTGSGIVSDSSGTTKKVAVTTDKVVIENLGLTKKNDLVLKITNNNNGSVCLSDVSCVIKDSNGAFVEKTSTEQSFVCIPANSSTYVYIWGYERNLEKYTNFEFSCELANIYDDFIYDGINITSNDTGKQIAVQLDNNSGTTITSSQVTVLYYLNGKIVGVETGYSDDTVNNGQSAYINVSYDHDSDYNDITYDKYEVYYTKASTN